MRKIVLALFLALAALTAGIHQAAAMDGFDLGDMPPLPPPLLDDTPTPPPLTPPAGGMQSPLVQGGSSTGLTPMAPPPGATPSVPPISADTGGMDFASPLPPAPPLSPPPMVSPGSASGGSLTPPSSAGQSLALPGQLDGSAMSVAVSQTPSIPETPRLGRIEGGRVNVRAGPNTQYESIAVLTSGAPVTVLAKHGEWYKIVFPADQLASIPKSVVSADITGEIPEAGLPGVVNSDNASVHAFYWDKSTVVCTLPRGTPVIIKQERGQWYRIAAPENARAYVFATYVRLDGNPDVAMDTAPAPVNPSVDLNAPTDADGKAKPAKLSKDQERVLEIKEAYYKRLQDRFEAEREAEEAEAKAAAEAKKLQATQLESALEDLDSRLAAIDQETSQRITYIAREFMPPQQTMITAVGAASWAPPDPAGGGYTGWIENIGRVGGAPTPFRLTKGGEIRFYLVSDQFNLNEFTNRRVWLNGPVEFAGGASASVLKVDQIRILTELEIAESVRLQQAGGYGGQMDPYANDNYGFGSQYGTVQEYDSTGAPIMQAPPAMQAVPDMIGGGQYMGAPSGLDPFAGYGSDYSSSGSYGTADMATDPGAVYGSPVQGQPYGGGYGTGPVQQADPYSPQYNVYQTPGQPIPPPAGIQPSDPSQLPDVVGGSAQYYSAPSVDVGGGMTVGEVDTDRYERPVINEIAP